MTRAETAVRQVRGARARETSERRDETLQRSARIHAQWESEYLNADLDRFYDECYARIVEKLECPAEARILDAGCGYGHHAVRLASHGLRVTGVDFSEIALEAGRSAVREAGLQDFVSLQKGDLLALPFDDESFEYVNCWGVLMHIPELERALFELARVLVLGGKLVLTENNAHSLDVRVMEPSIRLIKRVLGRKVHDRKRTLRGVEEWHETDQGKLMVRKSDMRYLISCCESLGLTLVDRYACQFTESYTNMPTRRLKRIVYAWNRLWFDHVKNPSLSLGNTLIFEKTAVVPAFAGQAERREAAAVPRRGAQVTDGTVVGPITSA